jgi:hypothetical protein
VELKNEMNPEDSAAMAWARALLPVVRQTLPATPVTISVAGSAGTAGLRLLREQLATAPPDYYDFHFYASSGRALALIREAQAIAAPTPIVIGEVGLSTTVSTEPEQAAYLARVFTAAREAGVGSVAPWTLTDFSPLAIPVGTSVAASPAQHRYGLHRADGSRKPAATVVQDAWAGVPLSESLLNPGFESTSGLSPWQRFLPELGSGVQTPSVAHSGGGSAMFTNTGGTSGGMPSLRLSPIEPVQAGQLWRVQVWAKGSMATGTNQLALSWFDVTGRYLTQTSSAPLPAGTTSWTALSVRATAPAAAASVEIHLKSGNNTGTVWFDDMTIAH